MCGLWRGSETAIESFREYWRGRGGDTAKRDSRYDDRPRAALAPRDAHAALDGIGDERGLCVLCSCIVAN